MIEIDNILDVEKYIDDVDAVIFDLDDTLYNEIDYIKSGFKAIANTYPEIDTLYEDLLYAFEHSKQAINEAFIKHSMEDKIDEALNIYRNHVPNITLRREVMNMLERIKQTKKVAIITEGRPEGQRLKLRALQLLDIPFIINDEFGGIEYRKPNEYGFIKMCERLDVDFNKAVYIGDNINKDLIAPEKLGMKSIYLKNNTGIYFKK